MVDVARHVRARRAVDAELAVDDEHVARAARFAAVGFVVGKSRAPIGGDVAAALDGLDRKQAEPGLRAADPVEGIRHNLRLAAAARFVIPFGGYPHLLARRNSPTRRR